MWAVLLTLASFASAAIRLPLSQLAIPLLASLTIAAASVVVVLGVWPFKHLHLHWAFIAILLASAILVTKSLVWLAPLLAVSAILSLRGPKWRWRIEFAWLFVMLTMLAGATYQIGRAQWDQVHLAVSTGEVSGQPTASRSVFWILPDRLASPEVFATIGHDSGPFVDALRERGFYVRENAAVDSQGSVLSGHFGGEGQTMESLAFMFNLETPSRQLEYIEGLSMIRGNKAARLATALGYEPHHLGSWMQESARSPQAINHIYKGNALENLFGGEFGWMWLDATLYRYWPQPFTRLHRQSIWQLEQTIDLASSEKPVYAFTHLLLPHPPFVWSAGGEPVDAPPNSEEEQLAAYRAQTDWTEAFLLATVDLILADSLAITPHTPAIIIQADEGLKVNVPGIDERLTEEQKMGIFTAWYIPGATQAELDGLSIYEVLEFALRR